MSLLTRQSTAPLPKSTVPLPRSTLNLPKTTLNLPRLTRSPHPHMMPLLCPTGSPRCMTPLPLLMTLLTPMAPLWLMLCPVTMPQLTTNSRELQIIVTF